MDAARILRASPRPGTRPGGAAVTASILLHGALALAAWWSLGRGSAAPRTDFRVYRVNIVSPPPQAFGAPTLAPPVVNPAKDARPDAKAAAPPAPAPKAAARLVEKQSAAAKKAADAAARGKSSAQAPARGWKPHPDAAVGGSGINVQMQGEEFPYPGYLENIILQISRFFRWSGSPDLVAEAYFVINRDGSVSDIQVTRSSGSVAFDITVRGAIEVAGNRHAFGRLPKGFQGDRLPVSFYFQPPR
jgi:periplasmic protein TonB